MAIGLSSVQDAISKVTGDSVAKSKPAGKILRYPLDIDENDGQELMRFAIVDRKSLEEQRSIYLYTPPGVAIPDAASYNQADLGLIGGAGQSLTDAFASDNVTEDESLQKNTIGDLIGAVTTKAAKASGPIGEAGLIAAGTASNPYTNVAFTGTTLRSFNFTFKMVAESRDEAEQVRLIENTFRKFLYPKQQGTDYLLEYPPFFKIEFIRLSGGDAAPNKNMPFIHYSYLLNMNTTFNAGTNLYHTEGQPTEVDLSLTFQESKALIREDLYTDVDAYDSAEYTRVYSGPSRIPPNTTSGDS